MTGASKGQVEGKSGYSIRSAAVAAAAAVIILFALPAGADSPRSGARAGVLEIPSTETLTTADGKAYAEAGFESGDTGAWS